MQGINSFIKKKSKKNCFCRWRRWKYFKSCNSI
jgi:hypothetical protein